MEASKIGSMAREGKVNQCKTQRINKLFSPK